MRRATELAEAEQRVLLGVTGPPGVGKSTLGQGIVERVGHGTRLVGMDGFHLAQQQLIALGRADRKGAVDTFDAEGFVALIERLSRRSSEVVYAPAFNRQLEEPIAGAVAVQPSDRLIVVEGNYLLVSDHPWGTLRELLTEVWYCDRDEENRIADLIARHHTFGKPLAEAERWARGTDQRNADLIAGTRGSADGIVLLDTTWSSA